MTVPLHSIEWPAAEGTVPEEVVRFLEEGESRIDAYLAQDIRKRLPRFVPSDSEAVYQALRYIRDEQLAPGSRFCEWGSGFGMATCLAALVGFDSLGIEIESQLVERARNLAEHCGVQARFHCGDIVPKGFEYHEDGKGNAVELTESSLLPSQQQEREQYFHNEIDIGEFDLIFCYPWPGEAALIETLFERTAEEDTLLVTYCESGGVQIRRLVASD